LPASGTVDRPGVLSCIRFANIHRVSGRLEPMPQGGPGISVESGPRQAYDVSVVPAPDTHQPSFIHKTAGCPMQAIANRLEQRIPLTVRVDLCSLDIRHPAQEGLTENVSIHGARIVASTPWKPNERLNVWALPGDFRARARVVYCEPLGIHSFAIGLQLLASSGAWKKAPQQGPIDDPTSSAEAS
jgi:hypothetical protein